MARRGKKYKQVKKAQPKDALALKKALESLSKLSYSKFPGTVEMHLAINVPKEVEAKSIKGSVSLPNSASDKKVRIAVFASPENSELGKKAGAEFTDMEAIIKDVKAGKIEFDVAIATPDMMPKIAVLGKELGPRGLMPNPKTGTVTTDVAKAVEEYQKGKSTFACDDSGVMHFPIGKVTQSADELVENAMACLKAAEDVVNKPRNQMIKSLHVAPTMGPSIEVDMRSSENEE